MQASPRYSTAGNLPRTARTRGRKAAIVAIVVVVGLLAGLFVIRAVFGFIGTAYMQSANIDATATKQSAVGGTSSFSVTVTNKGGDITNFVIYANVEGRDNWFKHHSLTDSGSCSVDRSHDRFVCGPVAKGSTKTFTIQGTSIDAGHFTYRLTYADDRGGGWMAAAAGIDIAWSSRQNEWSEAVRG